ncbi:calmodulin-binding protein [Actinacidiphila sp. ITFR-21]|uniref:BP74-related protein n=1 Tax=Actinacidiphila sp. ITFR-21 TaxID=3075199 RepID=UPI00288B4714|nr:calmodulin-binding protein [Streptomyces sp. ITFR-21]WNI16756.1 calmodulin-binding protein [Streptomyces sp. ITFR-21]
MRRILSKLGALAAVALLACTATESAGAATPGPAAATAAPAYFVMRDVTGSEFTVQLTGHAEITEAREIVDEGLHKIVIGRIVKRPAFYNPQWSFHYDPATVTFADLAIEVCDATAPYVEGHLDEAGGAFLPGLYWCPWTGRLIREIHPS